ncbi:uncharacterized protein LOC120801149 isoform X2 [Lates japonicus]|uniref:Uncharacterized protein n=1 Tax=Lates japonicus TaxID=270547 RepID=A0AAD3MQA4_LATJO|nr:uncharacterized protein AKAME5_002881800 [Lates japonicus]
MTACSLNIFIIFTIYRSLISYSSHGFEVIQPLTQTVNLDGSASIRCEHNAKVSPVDVRLNSISPTDPSKRSPLCQKGKTDCKNITMYQEIPNKWLFTILNIGPEAMNILYECEFTVIDKNIDHTKRGKPTRLLKGEKEPKEACKPSPPPSPSSPPPALFPPPPLPSPQHYPLHWTLIGLLALTFIYSSVITFIYIRLKMTNNRDLDNGTYVEMRKAPLPRNAPFDIYCG